MWFATFNTAESWNIPSADVTAARIILSGCILSCSGVAPTEVTVTAGWAAVSVCEGLIAIWIVGVDDEVAATDEPQLDIPGMLTAGGLHQHNSNFIIRLMVKKYKTNMTDNNNTVWEY